MQEPKTDIDTDLVWKVNDAINNPGGSGGSRGTTSTATPTASEQEMHTLLQSMSQVKIGNKFTSNIIVDDRYNYSVVSFELIIIHVVDLTRTFQSQLMQLLGGMNDLEGAEG